MTAMDTTYPDHDAKPLTIAIQPRTLYGKVVYYPVCPKAKTFANLLHQATLTEPDLRHILRLGIEITYVHEHQEVTL